MALIKNKPNPVYRRGGERAQSMAFFAIVAVVVAVFAVGIVDYMQTTARVMETVAVADLAAHAGAQEVLLLPNGLLTVGSQGGGVATTYFLNQVPPHAQLVSVTCGRIQERPACQVSAQVQSAGLLIPTQWITVNAIGYMANGVTRGDQ